MIRFNGIVGKTLAAMVITTGLVIVIATWLVYQQTAAQERALRLQEITNRCALRTSAAEAVFTEIDRQVQLCRSIYQRQLGLQHDTWADSSLPPIGLDGARRLVPTDPTTQPALFIGTPAATDQAAIQQTGIAREILTEHGQSWCGQVGSMYLASPNRWLVGWGLGPAELVADMLPNDPILLPQQQAMIDGTPDMIRWSPAELEPASGTWHLGAYTHLDLTPPIAIVRSLRIDDVIEQAQAYQLNGVDTLIVDRLDRILASSRSGEQWSTAITNSRLADADDPVLQALDRLIDHEGPQSQVVHDPASRTFFAISRLPQPGWTMVSIHPAALVDGPAQAAAMRVLVGGGALLLLQLAILSAILQNRIAMPLHALLKAIQGITSGQRGLQLSTDRHDEIGDLARAFTGMDQSITDGEERLREANNALREREERARALLASAADAVILLADDTVVEANPRADALFGLEPGQMIGQPFLTWAPAKQADEELSPTLHQRQCSLAAQGETCQYAWRARRADGSSFEAEIGLTRVDLPGPLRLLAVIRDVSERNRLQREMRQVEKMESVGQLAGGIAHDFNNMLSVILGAAELLDDESLPGDTRERLLDSIVGTCERAGGLVNRLLSFARRSEALTTAIDVHRLLDDTLTLLERSLDKRITLTHTFSASQSKVLGDASQLENALLNLGINARDAMPDGGSLTYTSENVSLDGAACELDTGPVAPGEYLHLSVSDTGSGIPDDVRERIFEPFFTTKDVGKGTGLGLAAVYRCLIDHQGGISIDTTIGQGTTFHLYLPVSHQRDSGQVTATTRPIHSLSGMGVLLVDDEQMVRTIARQILLSFGMTVIEADDGLQAIEVFRQHHEHITVALIDAEMPGLRGPDCLRELRTIAPEIKAVLCSGFVRLRSKTELAEAGFQAQLDKPYRIHQMRQCLEEVLFDHDQRGRLAAPDHAP